jgi:hypothetical protein
MDDCTQMKSTVRLMAAGADGMKGANVPTDKDKVTTPTKMPVQLSKLPDQTGDIWQFAFQRVWTEYTAEATTNNRGMKLIQFRMTYNETPQEVVQGPGLEKIHCQRTETASGKRTNYYRDYEA